METPNKRQRVKKACNECRRRKRGCDQNLPCGPCSQSGFECAYNASLATTSARKMASRSAIATPDVESMERRDQSVLSTQGMMKPAQLSEYQTGAGIISEDQPRFVKRTSAIAFPRLLGISLNSERPPRLHSYGYNLGMREEEKSIDYGMLQITKEAVQLYAEAFFTLPIDMIDRTWFYEKVDEYYRDPQPRLGTILGGVFAIGSCLSEQHPAERDTIHWCKLCLEDSSISRRPSIEIIIGFSLRVWYLRMTTRPNCAWLASCTLVHLMESVGIHRDENIKRLAEFSSLTENRLRLLFWNIWAVHKILSLEYGRTPIELVITTQRASSTFLDIVSTENLERLDQIRTPEVFLIFTKADVAHYIFRCLWVSKLDVNTKILFKIGEEALRTAESSCLDLSKNIYFNTLGSVFQFACILMALRTPESLNILPKAIRVLELISERANSTMAKDALAVAKSLLGSVIQMKRGELDALDAIYTQGIPTPASTFTDVAFDFDWTLFDEEFGNINGISSLAP